MEGLPNQRRTQGSSPSVKFTMPTGASPAGSGVVSLAAYTVPSLSMWGNPMEALGASSLLSATIAPSTGLGLPSVCATYSSTCKQEWGGGVESAQQPE